MFEIFSFTLKLQYNNETLLYLSTSARCCFYALWLAVFWCTISFKHTVTSSLSWNPRAPRLVLWELTGSASHFTYFEFHKISRFTCASGGTRPCSCSFCATWVARTFPPTPISVLVATVMLVAFSCHRAASFACSLFWIRKTIPVPPHEATTALSTAGTITRPRTPMWARDCVAFFNSNKTLVTIIWIIRDTSAFSYLCPATTRGIALTPLRPHGVIRRYPWRCVEYILLGLIAECRSITTGS